MHDSEAVEHLDDSGDDNERFRVALDKIPPAVTKIAFTFTIHDADTRRQNFGQIVDAFIRVADEASGKEIYRHKSEWKFNAVGAGFSGGLAALCRNFGIDVA